MKEKGGNKLVLLPGRHVGCSVSPYSLFSWQSIRPIEYILRIAVFGTYLGHGYFALGVREGWIPLITSFGFSEETAVTLLPLIGIQDVLIALVVMIVPIRGVLIWAVIWAFAAALSRPIAGEPIAEFIERAGNWGAPLALLVVQGLPKNLRELFTVR